MKKLFDYLKAHAFAISCWIYLAFVALVPLSIFLGYLPGNYAMDNLGMVLLLVSLIGTGPVAMIALFLGSRRKTKELETGGEPQHLWKQVQGTVICTLIAIFLIAVLEMFGSDDLLILPLLFAYCVAGLLVVMNLFRMNGAFKNSEDAFRRARIARTVVLVLCSSLAVLVVVMTCLSRPKSVRHIDVDPRWHPVVGEEPTEVHDFYTGNFALDPYFAMIPSRDRSEDVAEWPSIPGIERASCLEFCPTDTCYCKRLVLLIGSPKEKPLLEWVNEYVCDYLDDIGYERLRLLRNPVDAKQIADYYVGQARERIRAGRCKHDPYQSDAITEQHALFVGVSLLSDELCTFMTHTWNDQLSCGDGTIRSWYSVMRKTGKELELQDFISEEGEDTFLDLLAANLRNHAGMWVDLGESIDRDYMLSYMGGCALVEEGMVVYYHPYTIGCGADGQFNALIPYEDLLPIIRRDSKLVDWITQIQQSEK